MPESPEVKIMMNTVASLSLGRDLLSVRVIKGDFQKKTKGLEKLPNVLPKRITAVETKGKFGYILLEDGSAIGITFGMSGNIRIYPTPEYLESRGETEEQYMKHCKVEFQVQARDRLETATFYFHCVRNFEWIRYLTRQELDKKLSTIGPSILSDKPLDQWALVAIWRKYNERSVCEALMEQKLVSGIGNYIKAETLYRSGTYPLAKLKDLNDDHLWLLYTEARDIAAESYATGLHGDRPDFKSKLQVYDRSKDPHGNVVERLQTPDKRTTHWVSSVQTIGRLGLGLPKTTERPAPKTTPKIKAKIKAPILQDVSN
jgi:formamidopyrimidine-DNA glycosylase